MCSTMFFYLLSVVVIVDSVLYWDRFLPFCYQNERTLFLFSSVVLGDFL